MRRISWIPTVPVLVFLAAAWARAGTPSYQSVFGEGGKWDDDFAARQLEKFKALKPDPAVLAKIEALGDDAWLSLTPQGDEAPEAGRSEVPMVYMPDFKAFAFICGCTDPGYSSDTWFYSPSANHWVQMWPNFIKGSAANNLNKGPYPANRPATRCSLGLAYEMEKKVLVNHGGANAGTMGLKTFVLDVATNRWSEALSENAPGPKRTEDNCVGYAPGFGVVEIVPMGKSSETWRYRAAEKKWEKVAVKTAAPCTNNARPVWNSKEKKLIYHTGAEVWALDPAMPDWENLTPEKKGPPRYRHGNAYDPFNNVLITYGGKSESSMWVFEFATKTWKEIKSAGMPARPDQRMAMDFDTDLNVCVIRDGKSVLFYRYKRKP